MSRQDRLKEYANPRHRPQGASRDQKNVDAWADRAAANSKLAPRATDGPIRLPSAMVNIRNTAMAPKVSRGVDARMAGKADSNHVGGGPFMKSIRRQS